MAWTVSSVHSILLIMSSIVIIWILSKYPTNLWNSQIINDISNEYDIALPLRRLEKMSREDAIFEDFLKSVWGMKDKLSKGQLEKVAEVLNLMPKVDRKMPGEIKLTSMARSGLQHLMQSHERKFHRAPNRRRIFIDLGTNDGASLSYFFEESHGEGNIAVQGGTDEDGLKSLGANASFHLFAAEPNPKFTKGLLEKRDKYLAEGVVKSFTLLSETAVTTRNGPIEVISDTPDLSDSGAGVSLMNNSHSAVGPRIPVTGLSIVTLMKDIVKARMRDFIILKMDVEGHEFDLLQKLISSGWINYVDVLAAEYHHTNFWVFANDVKKQEFYGNRYDCIDWFMQDTNVTRTLWN